ncbi:MAG: hypothetical protein IKR86_03535 [Candidatus Methanomethylophilaceae archaeon]|nr:hypothetical protein [Candidatus Methanomethylophilaceae archaeon]
MDLNSLSRIISVVWLGVLVFRLVMMTVPLASTSQGQAFMTAVNIVLIGGLVLIGIVIGRSLLNYTAAKTMRSSHCQQCYAKLEKGAEFCPSCGKKV